MELKGAFSYLIQIVSDFVNDQLIFNLLQDLKGLLDSRDTKDIEIKKFVLHFGKESSKQIQSKVNMRTKTNCDQILQALPQQELECNILQPININSLYNTPRAQKEIQTSRSSLNTIFQNLQLNERNDQHNSRVKRNVKKLQFILEPNAITSANEEQIAISSFLNSCEKSKTKRKENESTITEKHLNFKTIKEMLDFAIQDMNNNTIEFLQHNNIQPTQLTYKTDKSSQLFRPLGKWYLSIKRK